ncbi:3-oxo-tetronate kinase [Parasulfitobacter algicola]|uniref:3-oxo-tetronate kinase n=1 Tax=Parasulfitobacter algicola TaxID=2614809 RepID=A0ABX2IK59_9RHOB|nr:3-oxo-tetronate kinase [Sulfitobacter algicola]NSX53266.1 four-carbon acid sugar kinase family protein [Sulfitobacter algicola]
MLLGVIGDDFTGSSDVGNMLVKGGMHTVQYVGIPNVPADPWVEAGVIALKSRSIPVQAAIEQSLAALTWLQDQGCQQILFKYCSTFDSTPQGNIGPVTEALAKALSAQGVVICPAFPATGRSIYQGHLFVKDTLLNESGMENHPLTPMSDPDLRRWLRHQTNGDVGHIAYETVAKGVDAIRQRMNDEITLGRNLVVADAILDDDLHVLGHALADRKLLTGGSGIALGLPDNFRRNGSLSGSGKTWTPQQDGKTAILSGSCSNATREQVSRHIARHPSREITAQAIMSDTLNAADLANWAKAQDGLPLIYSSADPKAVRTAQDQYGGDELAHRFETLFGQIARALVADGVTRLITAGGETSGAVVEALDPDQLEIGPEIAPGVPAIRAHADLVLALKSGNFGGPDFFEDANAILCKT